MRKLMAVSLALFVATAAYATVPTERAKANDETEQAGNENITANFNKPTDEKSRDCGCGKDKTKTNKKR